MLPLMYPHQLSALQSFALSLPLRQQFASVQQEHNDICGDYQTVCSYLQTEALCACVRVCVHAACRMCALSPDSYH